MNALHVIITFSHILGYVCQTCPSKYLRYSKEHSFCKSRNKSCKIIGSQMTEDMRKQVLGIHNKYRNKIAKGIPGLPPAADMIEMVWDKELEIMMQKHLEQCQFKHDCPSCKEVDNFEVGQNLYLFKLTTKVISYQSSKSKKVPEWEAALKSFFDEKTYFNKGLVKFYRTSREVGLSEKQTYSHFTQLIWAKSWRLGCGFVTIDKPGGYENLLGCNYGPGGNVKSLPVYTAGKICSACPKNSCCGKSCGNSKYDGLCRIKGNVAPLYSRSDKSFFYCDFRSFKGDCRKSFKGVRWKLVHALNDPFCEVTLKGGESSTLELKKIIKPKSKRDFCLKVKYRLGPQVAGGKARANAALIFGARKEKKRNNLPTAINVITSKFQHPYMPRIKISVSFSVPRGSPPQYLRLHSIVVDEGKC